MPKLYGINKLYLSQNIVFGCSESQITGLSLPFLLFYLYFCLYLKKNHLEFLLSIITVLAAENI